MTPVDAGDTKAVKQVEKAHKLRRLAETEHLREVLGTVSGRAVLWAVLEDCGIYRLSYHNNPHETAFREGNRQVGLRLLAEIHAAAPHAYIQMQQEATKRTQGGSNV